MIKKLGMTRFFVLLEELPVPGVDGALVPGALGVAVGGGGGGSWAARELGK
jgi:hypothetical protein